MLYFLYGSDTYRSRQGLIDLIERCKKSQKNGPALFLFEENNFSFENFWNVFNSQSMFQEKKIIVIKNFFQNSELKEKFLKIKQKILESSDFIIFYYEGEIKKNEKLVKFLLEKAECQNFEPLDVYNLKIWVKQEFLKYNIKIEPKIVDLLIEYCGNDLWQLSNEIKKLSTYKNGIISIKDVELMVRPRVETDIFKTIEAVARKEKREAIFLIHKHLEKRDSPIYLFSMINFQFKNLLMAKSDRFWGQGKHPYFFKKIENLANKFSLDDLKRIYRAIFEMDIKIKTGKISPEAALDLLIAEI